jgi:hypothetical protein
MISLYSSTAVVYGWGEQNSIGGVNGIPYDAFVLIFGQEVTHTVIPWI